MSMFMAAVLNDLLKRLLWQYGNIRFAEDQIVMSLVG